LEGDQSALRLELILNGLETPDTQAHGLGYSTDEEWQSLADVEANYGPEDVRIPEALPPDTYYTNEFLPEEAIQP
jgi:hypothetical protein